MLLSHRYLLSTYYVSGTILSTRDRAVTEIDKNSFFPGIGVPVTWGGGWARAGRVW